MSVSLEDRGTQHPACHTPHTNRQIEIGGIPPWLRSGKGDDILNKYTTGRSGRSKSRQGTDSPKAFDNAHP